MQSHGIGAVYGGNKCYIHAEDLSFRFHGLLNLQLTIAAVYTTLTDNFSG
jgi:hypothetical protein